MKSVLYTMMVAAFLNPFASSSLTMSFPDMMREFGASTNDMAWVVEAFLLCCTVAVIPAGKLADMYGKRKLFYIGSIVFTVISVCMCFVDSVEMLMFYRALQGVALGIVYTTSMSILTLSVPVERRGYAFGMIGGMVYLGLSLGPALGGLLNYYYGWRSIFVFTALLGVVANGMAFRSLQQEWVHAPDSNLSFSSLILYAFGISAIMIGITEWVRFWWSAYAIVVGIAALSVLGYKEWNSKDPLIPVRIFASNLGFTMSSIAAMMNFSSTFGVGFVLSLFLQMIMGFDSRMTGLTLCIQTGIMVFLAPRMGALSDRYNPSRFARWGMVLIGIGLLSMAYGTFTESLSIIMSSLAIVGIGVSSFAPPNNNLIMSSVPKTYISFASSTISTVRLLGQTMSMALIGVILAYTIEGMSTLQMMEYNSTVALIAFGVICLVGAIPAGMGGSSKHTVDC